MRRRICIIATCLLLSFTTNIFAADIDLTTMTTEELKKLDKDIKKELAKRSKNESAEPSKTTEVVDIVPETSQTETVAAPQGVSPDFKEYMDQLEAFFNSYCDFIQNYDSSDLGALTDYLKMTMDYAEYIDKMEEIDEDSLSAEDYKYYIDVMARIEKRLIDAGEY